MRYSLNYIRKFKQTPRFSYWGRTISLRKRVKILFGSIWQNMSTQSSISLGAGLTTLLFGQRP